MPQLTQVEFEFYGPDGSAYKNKAFVIKLANSGFVQYQDGVVLPDTIYAATDEFGKAIVEIMPSSTPYFVHVLSDDISYTDCCVPDLARFKFYVPQTDELVRAQDLFIEVPPSTTAYDEAAILIITAAKVAAVNAAAQAAASALEAEEWADSVAGDAQSARDSAASALVSKNAAAVSANAANNSAISASGDAGRAAASATAADTSKAAAALSETNALTSKNAAAASATSAATSATTATTQATSATGSATTATTQAAAALASKNAAALSATSASTSATTATTQAGIATTEANRSKTEADRAAAATDGKQPLATNLTAFAGLAGAVDRLPYFTGAGALSLVVLTAKARLLFARTDTAGMQAELGLVPVASTTDTTSTKLVTPGWMGRGALVGVVLPGSDANAAVPNGRYTVPATWVGSPYTGTAGSNQGWLDSEINTSTAYVSQVFTPLSTNLPTMRRFKNTNVWGDWESFATLDGNGVIPVNKGGTGVPSLTAAFVALRDGTPLSVSVGLAERRRMKFFEPATYVLDMDDVSASQLLGPAYVNSATVGTKPSGYAFGILETLLNASDHVQQIYTGITGLPGVTNPAFRRTGYGVSSTRWGPWRLIIDENSATLDPAVGGLMGTTTVSGWMVYKFANGQMCLTGATPTSPSIAANAFGFWDVTIPNILNNSYIAPVTVSASPTGGWDYSGACATLTAATTVRIQIRNGALAQTFNSQLCIWGRWK